MKDCKSKKWNSMDRTTVWYDNRNTSVHRRVLNNQIVTTHYVIGICTDGYVRFERDEEEYVFQVGDGLILPPGVKLRALASSKDYYAMYVLINPDDAHSLIKVKESIYYKELCLMPVSRLVPEDALLIKKYIETISLHLNTNQQHLFNDIATKLLIDSFQLEFVGHYMSQILSEVDADALNTDSDHHVFEEFLSLIERHHKTERSVSFYASQAHMTRRNFSRVIKKISGKPAKDWINLAILESSIKLLIETDLSIKELVPRLGFSSSPVFTSFFKKETGVSSQEFRDNRADL